jgi:hypothetical protein
MKSRVFILPPPRNLGSSDLERYRTLAVLLANQGTVRIALSLVGQDPGTMMRSVVRLLRKSFGVTSRIDRQTWSIVEGAGVVNFTLICKSVAATSFYEDADVLRLDGAPWHADNCAADGKNVSRIIEAVQRGPVIVIYSFKDDPSGRVHDRFEVQVMTVKLLRAHSITGLTIGVTRMDWPLDPGGMCRIDIGIEPAIARVDPELVAGEHVIDLDTNPYIPNGWTIETHIKGGKFKWDPARVSFYLSDQQCPYSHGMEGDKLRKELEGKPVLNANVLDYLLKNPQCIPEEWKSKYVFFWGTIYRDLGGDLTVRCLCWSVDQWSCSSHSLDDQGWTGQGWNAWEVAAVFTE